MCWDGAHRSHICSCTGAGAHPSLPRPRRDSAHPAHICAGTWAHPAHICTGTGLTPPASASGLGSPRSHLHLDWAHPAHICTGTWAHPTHICTGTRAHPVADSMGRSVTSRISSPLIALHSTSAALHHCPVHPPSHRCIDATVCVARSGRCIVATRVTLAPVPVALACFRKPDRPVAVLSQAGSPGCRLQRRGGCGNICLPSATGRPQRCVEAVGSCQRCTHAPCRVCA
jgi:hypothetical protein